MRFLKSVVVIAILIYFPINGFSWGQQGHRIVGQIAESYLTPKAKAEIKKILGDESIAIASNWADFIKSDTTMKYLSPWHYADFPKGLSYEQFKEELKKDTTADAYTKLNFLISALKKKTLPLDTKRMYLRLLIHIVGDIHQPLHVSPEGTEGGNTVKVTWMGQNTNLHTVWDSQLIDFQQLSYTEYTTAINHTTAAQRKAWQQQPMSAWLFQSYTLSQMILNDINEHNTKLSYLYNFQHIKMLNDQLVQGGVHLAGMLNDIFR